jgi:hypothetical protein
MPAPRLIADAERDVARAVAAARSLGATATPGLEQAECLLAEVRHFVYSVSDSKGLNMQADIERLLFSILGFKVEVTGARFERNKIEGFHRLAH